MGDKDLNGFSGGGGGAGASETERELAALRLENERLKDELANLRRILYGRKANDSTSSRLRDALRE